MVYLCEKYAPLNGLPEYDPQKDPSIRKEMDINADNASI